MRGRSPSILVRTLIAHTSTRRLPPRCRCARRFLPAACRDSVWRERPHRRHSTYYRVCLRRQRRHGLGRGRAVGTPSWCSRRSVCSRCRELVETRHKWTGADPCGHSNAPFQGTGMGSNSIPATRVATTRRCVPRGLIGSCHTWHVLDDPAQTARPDFSLMTVRQLRDSHVKGMDPRSVS